MKVVGEKNWKKTQHCIGEETVEWLFVTGEHCGEEKRFVERWTVIEVTSAAACHPLHSHTEAI